MVIWLPLNIIGSEPGGNPNLDPELRNKLPNPCPDASSAVAPDPRTQCLKTDVALGGPFHGLSTLVAFLSQTLREITGVSHLFQTAPFQPAEELVICNTPEFRPLPLFEFFCFNQFAMLDVLLICQLIA